MSYLDGPPLATPDDLAAYTGLTIPEPQAEMALRLASGMVRRFTGQTITLVVDDTVVLRGGWPTLYLPQRPVLVDDDYTLTVTELGDVGLPDLLLADGLTFTRLGDELTRDCGVWSSRVQVTYSHGYDMVPDDILAVVLDVASRSVSNPSGLRSVSIDDYSRTFANETLGTSLTEANRQILAGYRRTPRSAVLS